MLSALATLSVTGCDLSGSSSPITVIKMTSREASTQPRPGSVPVPTTTSPRPTTTTSRPPTTTSASPTTTTSASPSTTSIRPTTTTTSAGPGGGALPLPNEPAGFSQLENIDFSSKYFGSGWLVIDPTITNNYLHHPLFTSIQQDPTAPVSPGSVVRYLYTPANSADGSFSARNIKAWAQPRAHFYLSVWFKHSADWTFHPSGVNKMFYFGTNGAVPGGEVQAEVIVNYREEPFCPPARSGSGGVIDLIMQGNYLTTTLDSSGNEVPYPRRSSFDCAGTGPLTVDSQRILSANRGTMLVTPGEWHQLEAVFTQSQAGRRNGTATWWVDGQLMGQHNDVQWAARLDSLFTGLNIDPVWGGRGSAKPADESLSYDHFYASGSN